MTIDREYVTGILFFTMFFGGIALGCLIGMAVFG